MQIQQQVNHTSLFSCNVYIASSEKGNILFDPGFYDPEMKAYIEKIGGLDAILLTHGHWDHLYGLDGVKKDFPDARVYIPEKDHAFLTNPELNCSAASGFNLIVRSEAEPIQEGPLHVSGYDIDVIATPGHTIGSVMYYFKNENVLFSGDTVLIDVTGPTFRPTGSKTDMQASIRKFKRLGYAPDTPVYAGHRDVATYGYILAHNKDIITELGGEKQ